MAGVVHLPWYATFFRGDALEAALGEIAPVALRYRATRYSVQRSRDDRYKFLQLTWFETKQDWIRYWEGPEFLRWRAVNSSHYQVPIIYSWNDETALGRSELEEQVPLERPEPVGPLAGDNAGT